MPTSSMKAALFVKEKGEFEIKEVEIPALEKGEALVKIKTAALNHRDQWIREGRYPGLEDSILGSDGCGVVEKVKDTEHKAWEGKEVVIYPSVNWGDQQKAQGKDFEVLGVPTDGTFAEYIKMPIHHLYEKPAHLSDEEAAALPLAGLTAFRAIAAQAQVQEDEQVLVTGTGGGVAQMAVQFAHALGAKVYVTSGNDDKIQKAQNIGAQLGVNYKEDDWDKQLKESAGLMDVIIDSACGDQMNQLVDLLKPGGRWVFYGATLGKPKNLHVFKLFFKQITLQGTTMGSPQDFKNMLQLVNEQQITPVVDSVRPFDDISKAFDKMKKGQQMGKLVLRL